MPACKAFHSEPAPGTWRGEPSSACGGASFPFHDFMKQCAHRMEPSFPAGSFMLASIIIPVYGQTDMTLRCLEALAASRESSSLLHGASRGENQGRSGSSPDQQRRAGLSCRRKTPCPAPRGIFRKCGTHVLPAAQSQFCRSLQPRRAGSAGPLHMLSEQRYPARPVLGCLHC